MITAKTKDGESAIEIQGRKVWITRGSRLEAARRLERTGKSSSWVVLLSSLALVAVSIALFLPETSIHASARAFAELGALVGSVAILLVGIVEQGKSYELRADRHHRAAMELNQLSDRIRASASATAEEFAEDYHRIVRSFPDNHEPIDYHMFAVRHPQDFTLSWYEPLKVRFWWHTVANVPWLILGAVIWLLTWLLPRLTG